MKQGQDKAKNSGKPLKLRLHRIDDLDSHFLKSNNNYYYSKTTSKDTVRIARNHARKTCFYFMIILPQIDSIWQIEKSYKK